MSSAPTRLDPRDALKLTGFCVLALAAIASLWSGAILVRDFIVGDASYPISGAFARSSIHWGIRAALAPVVVILFQWFPPTRRNLARHAVAFLAWTSVQNAVQASVALGVWNLSGSSVLWSIGSNVLLNVVVYAGIGAGWAAMRNHRTALERIATEARVRRELVETRLRSLRNELNPEFVLGVLGKLPGLAARGEFRGVTRAISRLGELLRATLDTPYDALSDLATEIARTSILIEIRRAVDESPIEFEVDAQPAALTMGIPPLCLQALVQAVLEEGANRIELGASVEEGLLSLRLRAVTPKEPARERLMHAAEIFRERVRGSVGESSFSVDVIAGEPGSEIRLGERASGEPPVESAETETSERHARRAVPAGNGSRRLEERDARSLLAAVFLIGGAVVLIDTLDAIVLRVLPGGAAPLEVLTRWLQTWIPFLLAIPLMVGLLRRFPPSFRSAPLHVAWGLGLATSQIAAITSIRAAVAGTDRPPFLSLSSTPVIFAIHALVYGGAAIAYVALERQREAVRRAESEGFLAGELSRARLAVLRAQLNPHFLFNTLNAISTLALRNDALAVASSSRKLSDLLRYALEEPDSTDTELCREMKAVDGYLQIQKLRFGERLGVEFDLDETTLRTPVPRMILQPVVENAVMHGVAPKIGFGSIRIGSTASEGTLFLTVEDDGVGLNGARRSRPGLGLENARERLRCIYGAEAGVLVESRAGGGTRVVIRIPLVPREAA